MKIIILTLATKGWQDVSAISKPNKKRYAETHGYHFMQADYLIDDSRHASWNKILWIRKVIMFADWIFWTDCDSLIMNPKIKLEEIIGDTKKDLIIANVPVKESNRGEVNTGEFLIKRSYWTMEFLNKIYNINYLIKHPSWEQSAMHELLKNPIMESHVEYCEKRVLNSFITPYEMDYEEGDFIAHFTGMGKDKKNLIGLMKKYATGEPYECVDSGGRLLKMPESRNLQ